jgi:hypothetical protein
VAENSDTDETNRGTARVNNLPLDPLYGQFVPHQFLNINRNRGCDEKRKNNSHFQRSHALTLELSRVGITSEIMRQTCSCRYQAIALKCPTHDQNEFNRDFSIVIGKSWRGHASRGVLTGLFLINGQADLFHFFDFGDHDCMSPSSLKNNPARPHVFADEWH